MKIKTIDVSAKEWFDRINGNSYFAGTITVNYGMKDAKELIMKYQYGYGSQYTSEAMMVLINNKVIKDAESYTTGGYESLCGYCDRKKIILRTSKQEKCKLKELKEY